MKNVHYISYLNNEQRLKFISEEILNGKIIILPTDTIYGIIADAFNEKALEKIFIIKQRDKNKKFLILVNSIEMLKQICKVENEEIVKKFSYKPVTMILKPKISLSDYIILNGKVAVRITRNKILNRIISNLNKPVVAPSANISGKKNIRFFYTLIKTFKNKVDYIFYKFFILDMRPSTIIDVSCGKIKLIRKGRYVI